MNSPAGPKRISVAFIQHLDGPVDDLVAPFENTVFSVKRFMGRKFAEVDSERKIEIELTDGVRYAVESLSPDPGYGFVDDKIPELSIAENIFLGNETATRGVIDWDAANHRAIFSSFAA